MSGRRTFGPFDEDGIPSRIDELETTKAVSEGRPSTRASDPLRQGRPDEIEVERLSRSSPPEGASGAMIMFWPLGTNGSGRE